MIPDFRLDPADPDPRDLNDADPFGIDLNRKFEQVPQTVGGFFRAVCLDQGNQVLFALSFCVFALQLLPHWYTPLIHSLFIWLYLLLLMLLVPVLLVVSAGFVVAWLLTRSDIRQRARYQSRAVCFMACIALLPLMFGLSLAYARGLPSGSFARSFDSAVWKDDACRYSQDNISERQKMLGDAIRKVVMNKTEAEIISQLGPSTESHDRTSGHGLTYCLGDERGFISIDSEWLSIWFDSNGRATRYLVWTD